MLDLHAADTVHVLIQDDSVLDHDNWPNELFVAEELLIYSPIVGAHRIRSIFRLESCTTDCLAMTNVYNKIFRTVATGGVENHITLFLKTDSREKSSVCSTASGSV